MGVFSSISGFFVGQRHQLVQSLPSSIVIVLISNSTASALLVHRYHPTFDLIAVQDQQLTGQQQYATQNYIYALEPNMQPAIMDPYGGPCDSPCGGPCGGPSGGSNGGPCGGLCGGLSGGPRCGPPCFGSLRQQPPRPRRHPDGARCAPYWRPVFCRR